MTPERRNKMLKESHRREAAEHWQRAVLGVSLIALSAAGTVALLIWIWSLT